MRRRLTPRTFTVVGAAALLFLAATTAQAGYLFVLAAGLLGVVVGSLFVRHPLGDAQIARELPPRARMGDEVAAALVVRNAGKRTLPLMRIEDHHRGFDPVAVLAERLEPGGEARLELVRKALRRGAFEGGEIHLRAGAPFGFLRSARTIDVPSPLVVVPRWSELKSFPILEPSSFPADLLHERARTGAGLEFHAVREYRPGDPLRNVHWRSTARAGRLIVREFEEEVASRVSLVLAGPDHGEPPDSAYEALVAAAASIAIYALVTGHPVDILRPDAEGKPVQLGDPDKFGILDWLAHAEPIDAPVTPLAAHALERIGRRGTVVLLAPTAGVAGADLDQAVRAVQSAGSRAIVIAARSSSWTEERVAEARLEDLMGGRAPIKVMEKGMDLSRCLAA